MNQNALATREQTQISTQRAQNIDIFQLGKSFADSGYFQDAKDQAKAVVKIIYGQELGISPAASMSGIHIIQGKPVLSATALAGLIKSRRPAYDYKLLKLDEKFCEIEFFENGESVGKSNFSMEKAQQAELIGANSKNINWKKYPENMLFARAISNGARLYCPDIFVGSPIYTPDELGAQVDDTGAVVHDPTDNFAPAKAVKDDGDPFNPNARARGENVIKPERTEAERKIDQVSANVPQDAKPIGSGQTSAASRKLTEKALFDNSTGDASKIRELLAEPDEVTLRDPARTREKIRLFLVQAGIDPAASLRKYDTFTKLTDRELALSATRKRLEQSILENKRKEIEHVIGSPGWGYTPEKTQDWYEQITGVEQFSLINGTNEQLNLIIAELIGLGQLPE